MSATTSAHADRVASLAASVRMTIGGSRVRGATTFPVINPATGEQFADAPKCSREQVDDVMEAANAAYRTWRLDDRARCSAMRQAADELEAAADELALLLTAEQGKPLRDARSEVATGAVWLRWYADLDLSAPTVVQNDDQRTVAVHRRPLGVAVAIAPWNFPIQMALKKAAQALRPGNTLVVKPSPYTPLATLKAVEVMQNALPPGVVSAVSGTDDGLGTWMTTHPLVRKVSFTGSTRTGKLVAAAAAPDLKRVTLELGGNDAAIVLPDADPATVVDGLFERAFINCGQTCAAIKRIYVHQSLFAQVSAGLAERARHAVFGDGMDQRTQYGPLNNRAQLDIVTELVRDALDHGGRALTGGEPVDGPGYFYPPTIVVDVGDETRLVSQEQFGPVVPVLSFTDLDDAIERANRSNFGLGGSVWTSDPVQGEAVAARLECGTAWVNTHAMTTVSSPFGGAKWSGMGVENGIWGMDQFTQLQTIHTAH